MGRLIYSMILSLDGYVADSGGDFGWAEPDEEVLEAVNADTGEIGTYLYGRKIYELMQVWETDPAMLEYTPESTRFARLWQAADKHVYSTTLEQVVTQRTTLHRSFDPVQVAELKATASGDLTVDGPTLAAHALRAGLVDEVRMLVCPVSIGGGLRFLPENLRLDLELRRERAFTSGVVQLDYHVC